MSEVAITDLETVWRATLDTSGREDADALYIDLIAQLKKIATDFTLGKSIENIRDGYRILATAGHCIYYRADVINKVDIIRVLPR